MLQEKRKKSRYHDWYYGRCVPTGVVHLKQISKKISNMCTVTHPDILAVLAALVIQMKDYLQDGKKVVLDDFGSFRVAMRSRPAKTPKEFTDKNVIELRILFHPTTHLVNHHKAKDFLEGCKVEKIPHREPHQASPKGRMS